MNPVERFLRYIQIDTQSDESSSTVPSSPGQKILGALLVEELKALGLSDAHMDSNGYVMATLKGNVSRKTVIGLIAHMDTSPDCSGTDIQAKIIQNYNGADIALNPECMLSVQTFQEIQNYVGQDLIVTDGTTLLGADDKAGIAEIMTALEYWTAHPEIPRCTVRVCFTPDEEIGQGADHFDVKAFGAEFAYTLDGGTIGELEYENFNAASVRLDFHGVSIHPGSAKNKMVNAVLIGEEMMNMLPAAETPAHTEGYEGFFHVTDFIGTVEHAHMKIIIRDHDRQMFELRKAKIQRIASYLESKYGDGSVQVHMTDSYYNMKEQILPVFHIVQMAEKAMVECGIEPVIKPIRGGTDGSRLSYMGLPTPNIFTGGHNFHGRFEFIPIPSMEKAVETIVKLIELYALGADSEFHDIQKRNASKKNNQ